MTEGNRPEEVRDSSCMEAEPKRLFKDTLNVAVPDKKVLGVFAVVLAFAVLLSVLLTYSLTVNKFFKKGTEASHRLGLISELIEEYAYFPYDENVLIEAALDGYVGALDDRFAVFYNAQEYEDLIAKNTGVFGGIGVTVRSAQIEYHGSPTWVFEITDVPSESMAQRAGVQVGDCILSVFSEGGEIFINDISGDEALSLIRGEVGTEVTVSILRSLGNEEIVRQYTFARQTVLSRSVMYQRSEVDDAVGVVTIASFDLQTPKLLAESMDALIKDGLKKVIIDLRNNSGGDLGSVVACASYFLEKDALILEKEDKWGNRVAYRAVVRGGDCPVNEADIGKYSDLEYVILVNENTASAAEILSAVFRDHSIGTLVGQKTFGKGIVQTVFQVEKFGAVKFTTSLYYPPSGVCYHGVGITPDVLVENTADEDLQMKSAIDEFKK